MKRTQIILVLIFGGLAIWLEFRNLQVDAVFIYGMFDKIPLVILCILTFVYLLKNSIKFKQTKRYFHFIPSIVGISIIVVIFLHKQWRSSIDNSSTLFSATNDDLGSDGGFIIDFKTNNHLKAEKRDHWEVTYYWGSYEKKGDTLLLNLPLDFNMGRRAILKKDSLTFTDDPLHFEVYYPRPSSY